MKIFVFDTETTGLPKTRNTTKRGWHKLWGYIVQLSWIIYDSEKDKITQTADYYIKLQDGMTIPQESTKIHGITNEIMNEKGIPIQDALRYFYESVQDVDYLVAHNYEFDKNMLRAEFERNGCINYFDVIKAKEYCTMKNNIDFCAIQRVNIYNEPYYKWPRLYELHKKLFGSIPNNLHNALIDVYVCLRCFMKREFDRDILDTNQEFQSLYRKLL